MTVVTTTQVNRPERTGLCGTHCESLSGKATSRRYWTCVCEGQPVRHNKPGMCTTVYDLTFVWINPDNKIKIRNLLCLYNY